MLEYIEAIREIMEFSDQEKEISVIPNVAKVGGLQSQDGKGEAVVNYRKPLTTQGMEFSGFPEGEKHD